MFLFGLSLSVHSSGLPTGSLLLSEPMLGMVAWGPASGEGDPDSGWAPVAAVMAAWGSGGGEGGFFKGSALRVPGASAGASLVSSSWG